MTINLVRQARRLRGLAAAVIVAAAANACETLPPNGQEPAWNLTCPVQAGSAVTLVVGARANSPRTRVPDEVQVLLRAAALQGQKVQVIRVDGVPTVALTATFQTEGRNDQIRRRDLENFLTQTVQFVANLQPKQPEADLLGALTQAGQVTPEKGTIVVMDSGLVTTGPLSFRNAGMFGARADDVTAFLKAQHLMPDLTGRSVLFVGLGETADPQPALSGETHDQVGELWHTVAKNAGAVCDGDLRTALTRTAVSAAFPVTVVTPPPVPAFDRCGTTVLPDNSPVGFVVGKAEFRNPAAATTFLDSLAKVLEGYNQQIMLTGTTSSEGSDAANQTLSEQRAAAVKAVLVQLGVAESRVKTHGAGEKWPGREVDMTKDGVLIPAAAARNRSVVVELKCPK
ncbi:OmpA family protein [Allorhizocola rhizosphaerae]|uniref:OmpA family protein n=1 Tax=Allorhizocola rhizosphaerae TaxID=1872709 RepID=UPI000E3E6AA0|nr:OmpA family protein [Allorhizocola rhizosphaerae]